MRATARVDDRRDRRHSELSNPEKSVGERRVLHSLSINTQGTNTHCKSVFDTRSIIHILRHLDFDRRSTAGSIGPRGTPPAAARHGLPTN